MTVNATESAGLIRIGVSACLLGEEVRYDGGHKHNGYITQTLAQHFEFVPFCPEVAIGLGIPRPPIRLERRGDEIRAVGVRDESLDVSAPLLAYGHRIADENPALSGYIFKKGSPSCGLERVKVYGASAMPHSNGRGLYAAALTQHLPLMPVEEEGRLMDPVLRENFVERVFIYFRWQTLVAGGLTPAGLVDFHTRHKFSILAHDEQRYRALGRLVAQAGETDLVELGDTYAQTLMAALAHRATRRRHANVLMHVMGYLKRYLDSADKAELSELIDSYRTGLVPLIVPITLLKHHLRRHPDPYIDSQTYLNPHPQELMLRNSL